MDLPFAYLLQWQVRGIGVRWPSGIWLAGWFPVANASATWRKDSRDRHSPTAFTIQVVIGIHFARNQ
jgi:hypothetical protein